MLLIKTGEDMLHFQALVLKIAADVQETALPTLRRVLQEMSPSF